MTRSRSNSEDILLDLGVSQLFDLDDCGKLELDVGQEDHDIDLQWDCPAVPTLQPGPNALDTVNSISDQSLLQGEHSADSFSSLLKTDTLVDFKLELDEETASCTSPSICSSSYSQELLATVQRAPCVLQRGTSTIREDSKILHNYTTAQAQTWVLDTEEAISRRQRATEARREARIRWHARRQMRSAPNSGFSGAVKQGTGVVCSDVKGSMCSNNQHPPSANESKNPKKSGTKIFADQLSHHDDTEMCLSPPDDTFGSSFSKKDLKRKLKQDSSHLKAANPRLKSNKVSKINSLELDDDNFGSDIDESLLSKEAKKQRRLIRNRLSAQLHRERKKAYVDEIEAKLKDVEATCESYKLKIDFLEMENEHLHELVKSCVQCKSAGESLRLGRLRDLEERRKAPSKSPTERSVSMMVPASPGDNSSYTPPTSPETMSEAEPEQLSPPRQKLRTSLSSFANQEKVEIAQRGNTSAAGKTASGKRRRPALSKGLAVVMSMCISIACFGQLWTTTSGPNGGRDSPEFFGLPATRLLGDKNMAESIITASQSRSGRMLTMLEETDSRAVSSHISSSKTELLSRALWKPPLLSSPEEKPILKPQRNLRAGGIDRKRRNAPPAKALEVYKKIEKSVALRDMFVQWAYPQFASGKFGPSTSYVMFPQAVGVLNNLSGKTGTTLIPTLAKNQMQASIRESGTLSSTAHVLKSQHLDASGHKKSAVVPFLHTTPTTTEILPSPRKQVSSVTFTPAEKTDETKNVDNTPETEPYALFVFPISSVQVTDSGAVNPLDAARNFSESESDKTNIFEFEDNANRAKDANDGGENASKREDQWIEIGCRVLHTRRLDNLFHLDSRTTQHQ